MSITPKMFDAQRTRRFGAANPERMKLEFWEWMVRRREPMPADADPDFEPILATPYYARMHFGRDGDYSTPVWTFDRMGMSRTPLPDGRTICVGGEHEDYYDPDFCIYNDVVVLGPDDSVAIFGYPKEVFPPTDFHTASLVDGRLIVIGRIGYSEERRPGFTAVYAVHLDDYQVEPMATQGEAPGWIYKHEAEVVDGLIVVRGGQIHEEDGARGRRNFEEYGLRVADGTWERLTDRRWPYFTLEREDSGGLYSLPRESLVPPGTEAVVDIDAEEPWRGVRAVVAGVPVLVEVDYNRIDLVVQGRMNSEAVAALGESLRGRVEAAAGTACRLSRHR